MGEPGWLEESSIRREALVSFVTLYKALGGGWLRPEIGEGEEEDEEDGGNEKAGEADEAAAAP